MNRTLLIPTRIGANIFKHGYILAVALITALSASAQHNTFFEGFDNAEPGELPHGWTTWQNGGGGSPFVFWQTEKYHPLGVEKYVISNPENGRNGMVDEDWLITPSITPKAGDFLMFNTRRSFVDVGDQFNIVVSTTGNNAPDDFTDTVALFTEADIPINYDPVFNGKIKVDLSAFVDIPIHIAFVHGSDVGEEGISSLWLLDDIEVGPIQPAYVEETFFKQSTTPPQPPVLVNDEVILPGQVSFVVNGHSGEAIIESMTFSTQGTTDISLIREVEVYYTMFEYITHEDILNGVTPMFGSTTDIGETFTINGSMGLMPGTQHYFWLRYKLDGTRDLQFPYPKIDMTFEKYVANGVESTPDVTTFFGYMDVVPGVVENDHFEDAIEISTSHGHFGSSTKPASYQEEYDKLAYCQNEGFVEVNSVWWHFTAPADGFITIDLAESRFNTILTIFDEDLNMLACNNNINDNQLQSRIEDFLIDKGQKIFIRVSDIGSYLGMDWGEAGVVDMEFMFSVPVGTSDEYFSDVSLFYPNPAVSSASIDVQVTNPGEIVLDVRDALGKQAVRQIENVSTAGKHTAVLDAAALKPGTYFVHVYGVGISGTRKLIVTR